MNLAPRAKVVSNTLIGFALSAIFASAQVLSFDQAKQRADQGDAFAQAVVALHYQLGWNTQKNPGLAAEYAAASAEAGHPLGQFRLGAILRAGEGVPKDEQQGLTLQAASFNALYNAEDPYSITSAAIMISQGKVVGQNIAEDERRRDAAALYKKAAGMGYAPAMFNYIMCGIDGYGMPKHPATRLHFIRDPITGGGCTCPACSVDTNRLAEYPPAKQYVAENKAAAEEEIRAAALLNDAPPLDPEYWNVKQNSDTAIFEPPSMSGKSSEWYRLMTANGSVDVDVRANYTGLSQNIGGVSYWDVFISRLANDEGLFSTMQFVVVQTEKGLLIRPNSPLAKKNRMGLCEYPIALEFRITNRGASAVRVDNLGFDVKQSVVKDEMLPGLLFDQGDPRDNDDDSIVLHNFGWSAWEPAAWAKLMLWDKTQNATEYKDLQLGTNQSIRVSLKDLKFGPYISETLSVHPGYADRIMSLEVGKQRAWFDPNFCRNAADFYTRIDGDARLPAGRADFRLLFDAGKEIKAGKSLVLSVTFDFDRSVNAVLEPLLCIDNATFSGPAFACEYECLNHYYKPPNATFAIDGNGGVGVEYVQDAVLGISRDDGQISAQKQQELVSSLVGQTVLKPRMQSAVNMLVDGGVSGHCLLFQDRDISNSDRSLSITGCLRGTTISGNAILSTASDGRRIFQVPWSFDNVPPDAESVRISVTRGFADQWCAWLVRLGTRTRIYLAFPGKNATIFAPHSLDEVRPVDPCAALRRITVGEESEDNISKIGRDESGKSLIIQTMGSRQLLPLGSRILPMLQESINAENDMTSISPSDMADCSRLVLKVPAVKFDGDVIWSESQDVQIPKREQKSGQVTGILWPEPDIVAVEMGNAWNLWHLHFGSVSQASSEQATGFDASLEAIRRPVDRLLSKINQARQNGASRVQDAFALDAGSALLLVGKDFRRSGLSFDFYSKKTINRQPGHQFVLNPFGVRKQFAETTEFFREVALSPDGKRAVAATKSGNSLYLVDVSAPPARRDWVSTPTIQEDAICVVRSPLNPQKFSIVLKDGDYLSGDGTAAGLVLSDGHNALNLSQLEAKYNRPDIVLERLRADDSLVKEARRLRERLVRRSDFKSFEGAALIDIPVVTVKTEVPEKTGTKSLTLDFEASNSTGPLKELRVFNNGALVQTVPLAGKDGQPSREVSGDVEIDLASGENRLQLMAVSEEGFTSAFAEKRIECTAEPDSRRCFIATVGVSEYNDSRFNLKFAAKDAEDMSKALAEKAQHRGYQPEVMVVKNADVDGALVGKLREFLAQAGTDDEVVLFFAGHGLLDKNLEYHFARHDTDFDATENMGITFQELESLVDGIKPLKRTVLFDTCHSGEVEEEDKQQLLAMVGGAAAPDAGSGVQVRGVAMRGMKVKELEPKLRHTDFIELESLFPDSRRAKGANILTSSSGSEFSMESDAWQNGLFTFAFLNALKDEKTDANGDKTVSFSEAAAAVQDIVKTLSGGYQRPITRGVNREAEVALASFGPPVAPSPTKENKSGWWPF